MIFWKWVEVKTMKKGEKKALEGSYIKCKSVDNQNMEEAFEGARVGCCTKKWTLDVDHQRGMNRHPMLISTLSVGLTYLSALGFPNQCWLPISVTHSPGLINIAIFLINHSVFNFYSYYYTRQAEKKN